MNDLYVYWGSECSGIGIFILPDIVFVEKIEQVELIKSIPSNELIVICMNPALNVLIEKQSVKVINASLFFGKRQHETLFDASLKIEDLITCFEELLISNEDNVASSLKIDFDYYLRRILNYWISTSLIIDEALKEISPNKIFLIPSCLIRNLF